MRKMMLVVMVVLALVSTANAEISGSLASHCQPKYVGGDGALFYDDSVVQSNLFVGFSNSVYVDIWGSKSVSDGQNYGNEVDLAIGYAKNGLDIGLAYWNLMPVGTFSNEDILSPYAGFSKEWQYGLTPFVKAEGLVNLDGSGSKLRMHAGVKYAWLMAKDFSLNQKLSVVHATGNDAVWTARHDISLAWSVAKSVSVDISNSTFVPLNDSGHATQIVPAIGVIYSF